jgi:hypothetical protein
MRTETRVRGMVITVLFTLAPGVWGWSPNQVKAQTVGVPQFKYDPYWPKPLPDGWVLGSVGSVCVDARDHVFVVTRGEPAPKERNLAIPAPPVIEFDADGNVVNFRYARVDIAHFFRRVGKVGLARRRRVARAGARRRLGDRRVLLGSINEGAYRRGLRRHGCTTTSLPESHLART